MDELPSVGWSPDRNGGYRRGVMLELPTLPDLQLDVVQDVEGFDVELSAERQLNVVEADLFSSAVLTLAPVVRSEGDRLARGLVSVDDETLWVYVHSAGPGRFGTSEEAEARSLVEELWRGIHEAVAKA
jgi:hypothetical protein